MMRHIALFILIVVMTKAAPTFAEEATTEVAEEFIEPEPYDFSMLDWSEPIQLRPHQGWNMGGQALMAPVYFFAGILLHEGSHALLGMASGFTVDRFYPYPVVVPIQQNSESEPVDNFFWGLTIFEPRPVNETENWQVALTTIAPFMLNTMLFLTGDLLLEYAVNPHSAGAPFLLAGLMITPLSDFIVSLLSNNDSSDLQQFSAATGIPYGITAGIGWIAVLVGLWRVAHQFRRVFMEPTSVAEERRRSSIAVSILPITSEDMTGVGVVGRF